MKFSKLKQHQEKVLLDYKQMRKKGFFYQKRYEHDQEWHLNNHLQHEIHAQNKQLGNNEKKKPKKTNVLQSLSSLLACK